MISADRTRAARARLLRLPALCVTAVWLPDRRGTHLVPLPPAFGALAGVDSMPRRSFLAVAQETAIRLLVDVRRTRPRRERGGRR